MPRKSINEMVAKYDDKTQGFIETVSLYSPLRRSSRIKQNLKKNNSSPELSLNDVSNTQISRQQITTIDNTISIENQRNLRSRTNTISSDISTPIKKTRNNSSNNNKMTDNRRSKHFVRVESKTNSPSVRNAHNIRASSVEPETTSDKLTEKQNNELIKTSIKTKRQSLLIPSEITVTEEKEESMKLSRLTLNRTLSDINENIQSDSKNSFKPIQKNELPFPINKCDSSIYEEHLNNIDTPADFIEEVVDKKKQPEKEFMQNEFNDSIMLIKQCTNELKSEKKYPDNKIITKEYQKKFEVDDDSNTNLANLFQDVSAIEWKEKNNETDKNSLNLSNENIKNEKESECDLVLVDKEAWLSAEKLKKNKKKTFDYDSDDTIVLKVQRDSMKAENDTDILMDMSEDKCKLNNSKNKYSTSNKQQNVKDKNKEKKEVKSDIENVEEDVKLQSIGISDRKLLRDKTRKKSKKNYSTTANILSDSEKSNDISDSDDTQKKFMNIPKFLFAETSDSENNDSESNNSIDSDIQKEYNFHGKNIPNFSDDDIRGDECRASEIESSDPDDNGSDMADFIVDDDEVEEEEESESEEEENEEIKIEEKEDEESESEEKEDQEIEFEEKEDEESEEKENEEIEIEEKQDKEKEEEKDEEIENNVELDIEENVKKSKKNSKDKKRDQNIEKSLNGSQIIFNKKIKDLDVKMDNSNIKENVNESMVYSTPKINLSNKDKFNIKTYDVQKNLSLDEEKSKDITLKKKLKKLKSDESLAHRSLPSELIEFVAETNLSRPMSSKVLGLNKTTLVLGSDTPTTRYLKKDKLNESAPILKSDIMFKELTNTINSSKKNDQIEKENENDNEKNKISKEVDDSLEKESFGIVDNILENDLQKMQKKRKQSTVKEITDPIFENDSQLNKHNTEIVKKTEHFVPFINNDDNETKEVDKTKKKKKKTHDINIKKNIFDIETKSEDLNEKINKSKNLDEGIHNEINKKKKKKNILENISDSLNINKENNITKKEEQVSDILPKNNILNVQLSKNKNKKKKTHDTDVQIKEQIFKDIVEIKSKNLDKEIRKKKKKIRIENISNHNLSNIDKDINIVNEKEEYILSNNNISNELLSEEKKRKQKKLLKEVALQDKEELFEKIPQKKQKLLLKNTSMSNTIQKRKQSETYESKPSKKRKIFVEQDFSLPSNSGSTTDFDVIDIQKIRNKKNISFRDRMLARNSRQSVSIYMKYLKKQKMKSSVNNFMFH
ncbi:uncharacterized protein PF11_0213-like [Apis laboriosa]|uniref:uncharacterized protein PF11_0213-like n=1 Tax=Apis laboriosa TaxID=183418 RepID=UPI001CC52644|nr:uncharacterized protein PF11_0213-like [Apis laboriosa]